MNKIVAHIEASPPETQGFKWNFERKTKCGRWHNPTRSNGACFPHDVEIPDHFKVCAQCARHQQPK